MKNPTNKTLILLAGIVIMSATGCMERKTVFYPAYIQAYISGEKIKLSDPRPSQTPTDFRIDLSGSMVSVFSEGADRDAYDRLCAKNNDLRYDKEVRHLLPEGFDPPINRYAYDPEIASITVKCNRNFDETHPAGTPMNDYINLVFKNANAYVNGNYQGDEPTKEICKNLEEMTEDDWHLLYNINGMQITKEPLWEGEYDFTVIVTFENGKTRSGKVCKIAESIDGEVKFNRKVTQIYD